MHKLDALLWVGLMGHKSINHDCIYHMPYQLEGKGGKAVVWIRMYIQQARCSGHYPAANEVLLKHLVIKFLTTDPSSICTLSRRLVSLFF